jgi:hypothetical protein
MGLTVTPIEIPLFKVMVLVLKRLVIPAVCGLVEVTHNIRSPDSRWGVMGPVT